LGPYQPLYHLAPRGPPASEDRTGPLGGSPQHRVSHVTVDVRRRRDARVAPEVRRRLEDAGRDASKSEAIAAGLYANHVRRHAFPTGRCPFCQAAGGPPSGYRTTAAAGTNVDPLPDPDEVPD
jgi:hypothetical protein